MYVKMKIEKWGNQLEDSSYLVCLFADFLKIVHCCSLEACESLRILNLNVMLHKGLRYDNNLIARGQPDD